jgi:hypothetical protein
MTKDIRCVGCGKLPQEIDEYVRAAREEPKFFKSAEDYVTREEGTYNPQNGHFLCTACYINAGSPSSPAGWIAE